MHIHYTGITALIYERKLLVGIISIWKAYYKVYTAKIMLFFRE